MANPKGKKSITLTVPKNLEFTGRELKIILRQILFQSEYYYNKVDEELLRKLEIAVDF